MAVNDVTVTETVIGQPGYKGIWYRPIQPIQQLKTFSTPFRPPPLPREPSSQTTCLMVLSVPWIYITAGPGTRRFLLLD